MSDAATTGTTSLGTEGAGVDDVERTLGRIAKRESEVRAFVDHRPAQVRADAAAAPAGAALSGTCVAVKEVFDVAGYRCAWGTPIHAGRVPATDAEAVRRLKAAGGIVAGITVSTEYALARPGPTTNPHDASRTPGASSSGSAAAVGAGMVTMALGSQTIGSIIRPAAYCGAVGVKPTWGVIDVGGVMPLSEPLDHVGVIADRVAAARSLLSAIADGDALGIPSVEGVRILDLAPWFAEPVSTAMTAAVATAAARLHEAGLAVADATLADGIADDEEAVLMTLLCRDLVRHHGADFARAEAEMSPRLVGWMRQGETIDAADYHRALVRRNEIARRLDDLLGDDAVFLCPAALGAAPRREEGTGSRTPQRLWTLGGQPAVSVPVGDDGGLPLGVQIVAARGRDALALAVAEALEAGR